VPLWYVPASNLYSRPVPVGLVTVTDALPNPSEQSTVCTGLDGDGGCAFITTLDDAPDMQPDAFVTVYVYVPSEIPVTVVLVPVPVVVTEPGVRVSVHVPLDGKPLKTTLPVDNPQVG
jgi:hypothetical protein